MRASNRWDSSCSYGQSGLILSHDNVGSTKSWGPGFCVSRTCTLARSTSHESGPEVSATGRLTVPK